MALVGDTFQRQLQTKQDEATTLDQQLERLEDGVRRLKIDFDIFFNGGMKRAPLEARARLEANLKRISDDRNLTFAQRYRLSSITTRYTSYRELWRRMMKTRGEEIV